MITYIILAPGDEALGVLSSAEPPTIERLADELATAWGFEDRDALFFHHPGLRLGFAPVH